MYLLKYERLLEAPFNLDIRELNAVSLGDLCSSFISTKGSASDPAGGFFA
jgi:hypothetical protein